MSQLETEETRRKQWEWLMDLSKWLNTPEGKEFAKKYTEEPEFDFKVGDTVEIINITCEPTISSGVHIGDQHRILDVDILDECVFIDRFDGRWVAMEDLRLAKQEEPL